MCFKNSKKGKGNPFIVLLSMGCIKYYTSQKVFRERFYINGFATADQAQNFADRLQSFIIDNTERQVLRAHLFIVRPLRIIPPILTSLLTNAKKEAIEIDITSIEPVNNFNVILGRVFQELGI